MAWTYSNLTTVKAEFRNGKEKSQKKGKQMKQQTTKTNKTQTRIIKNNRFQKKRKIKDTFSKAYKEGPGDKILLSPFKRCFFAKNLMNLGTSSGFGFGVVKANEGAAELEEKHPFWCLKPDFSFEKRTDKPWQG